MGDYGRGGAHDADRLPWLEAVDDEDDDEGVGIGRLIGAVLVALVALALVAGGVMWLRDRPADEGEGDGTLIAAPAGSYKERPVEPGGMRVDGEGETTYAASAGQEVNAAIDVAALPETPVTAEENGGALAMKAPPPAAPVGRVALPPSRTTPVPAAPVAAPVPAAAPVAETPEPPAVGGTIQLGAFSSAAKANAAWDALAKRFALLAPLAKSVTPVTTRGATLYRLRAGAGDEARAICARLRVAGETCQVIG